MSEKIHKFVYQVTTFLIYAYAVGLAYSYDAYAGLTIGGLIAIRFLASELYYYEVNKKDQEMMMELEYVLQAKEEELMRQLEKKFGQSKNVENEIEK
jgi:hypothetical protein